MKQVSLFAAVCWAVFFTSTSEAVTVTMAPLANFGKNDSTGISDGWFSPNENGYAFLGIDSFERCLAFSAATNHLYLVSRTGAASVRVLDAATGKPLVDINTGEDVVLSVNGVGGGLFALNMIGVAEDGAIYAGNLTTNAASNFTKVYRWDNELAEPVRIFDAATLATRQGDTFDVIGSGANTRVVMGFGNNPDVPGDNGYSIIDPNDPEFDGVVNVGFATNPPAAGDFRLGITFIDSDTVLGTAGGLSGSRLTDFSGATGTLVKSLTLTAASERPMDFAIVNGIKLLATIETGSAATTDTVRIYDMTDPLTPLLLATRDNTTGVNNPNTLSGGGAIKWGAINGDTATLYAMQTNNGIQAFIVTVVPEPTSVALLPITALVLMASRQRRRVTQ